MDLIHHYTNIDTLALILKNKSIRFNRLDRVDDMSEAQAFDKFNLSKYLFVSCWTDSSKESIPQWHIYTNKMTGVIITFPKDLFHYQPLNPPATWNTIVNGQLLSPIPFNKLFTDNYLIIPTFLDKKDFERKVEYVDDVASFYKDAVDLKIDGKKFNLKIQKVGDLAKYKNKDWQFQSELRFMLFVFPSLPMPKTGLSDKQYIAQLPSHIGNCIKKSIGPDINYFDVEIKPDVLDNIIITTGPLIDKGNMLIIKSLLSKYTKNGSVKESNLTGTIRKPTK